MACHQILGDWRPARVACPHILGDWPLDCLTPCPARIACPHILDYWLGVSLLPVLPEWPHILGDRPLDCLVSVPAKLACPHAWLSASIFPSCLFLPGSPALTLGNLTLACLDACPFGLNCPHIWRAANGLSSCLFLSGSPALIHKEQPLGCLAAFLFRLACTPQSSRVNSGLPIAACSSQVHLPLYIKSSLWLPSCLFLTGSPALIHKEQPLGCLAAFLFRLACTPQSSRVTSGLPISACSCQGHLPLYIKSSLWLPSCLFLSGSPAHTLGERPL